MTTTAVMIPARIGSSRFPAKMLVDVEPGVTLIEKVFANVCKQWTRKDVFVVTDAEAIARLFPSENVIMTSFECPNGTARCAEAAEKLGDDYDRVINVQGDMIEIPEGVLKEIETEMSWTNQRHVVTVVTEMPQEMQDDPNTVKCVTSKNGHALWFARGITGYGEWHLGIYGYERSALSKYSELPESQEEKIESLEQLRWLKNGYNVFTVPVDGACAEINTPEDLQRWQSTQTN